MIKLSGDRVKRTGYWCAEGDKLTAQLSVELGKATSEWITPRDVLEHGGLSLAIQSLVGSPDEAAQTAALHYATWLHTQAVERWNIRMADAQPASTKSLGQHDRTASKLAKMWWELAKQAMLPTNRLLARTNFLLFTGKYPLAINCAHATKCYLTASRTGSLYATENAALTAATRAFEEALREANRAEAHS